MLLAFFLRTLLYQRSFNPLPGSGLKFSEIHQSLVCRFSHFERWVGVQTVDPWLIDHSGVSIIFFYPFPFNRKQFCSLDVWSNSVAIIFFFTCPLPTLSQATSHRCCLISPASINDHLIQESTSNKHLYPWTYFLELDVLPPRLS